MEEVEQNDNGGWFADDGLRVRVYCSICPVNWIVRSGVDDVSFYFIAGRRWPICDRHVSPSYLEWLSLRSAARREVTEEIVGHGLRIAFMAKTLCPIVAFLKNDK